jgi:beta-mannanase
MNGDWSWPWQNQPTNYRAAWRRVVGRFRRVGANNAEWVWSPMIMYPNGVRDFRPYYPGDAYVDWTALDGYNWGTVHTGWQTFREIFGYSIGVITELSTRGLIGAETGCHSWGPNGESKGYCFRQTARELRQNYPRLKGFVYSHTIDERDGEDADWRVDAPVGALDDWRALVGDPRFKTSLVRP